MYSYDCSAVTIDRVLVKFVDSKYMLCHLANGCFHLFVKWNTNYFCKLYKTTSNSEWLFQAFFCDTVNHLLRVILLLKSVLVIHHHCRMTSLWKRWLQTKMDMYSFPYWRLRSLHEFCLCLHCKLTEVNLNILFTLRGFQHQKIRMFPHGNLQKKQSMPVLYAQWQLLSQNSCLGETVWISCV